ncbi:hypothetical protein [Dactylosporangium sp. CA-092794]|uniref:hypothetical protein n=1 Tax=Dactylosporangium sp. CA-092794 TaxID=3239929 RepID=UPI003D8B305D
MDETGQAGSPDAADAYPGAGFGPNPAQSRGRAGYPDGSVNGAAPSDDALEAIVSAWREPATGAIAGRAAVGGLGGNGVNGNGVNGLNGNGLNGNGLNGNGSNGSPGTWGRAEVRSPYSDILAPLSPPVSGPPPTSTLHYGHYGPDGQGWPTSSPTGETKSVPAPPPPGTVYGGLSIDHHSGEYRRPVSGQPAFDQAPPAPSQPQPYEFEQPKYDPYEPPQSALDRVAEQQAAASHTANQWGYQSQYQPEPYQPEQYKAEPYQPEPYQPEPYQPEQRHWAPEPAKPEFDWASPTQHDSVPQPAVHPLPQPAAHPVPQPAAHPLPPQPPPQALPTQRVPDDDPLVGPLPPMLLGSATAMAAGPVMPTFADDMPQPAYEAVELPQRIPSAPDVPPLTAMGAPAPVVGAPAPVAPSVGAPELTRITNYLREDEDGVPESPDDRPDGFDMDAVLHAVRAVSGVHRATLRKNADGLHTLRLELADEADAGQVSRVVARMLNDTMGLSAEQNPLLPDDDRPEPPSAAVATPTSTPVQPPRPPARNAPHSALPSYGREARRRRPVSTGVRRVEQKPPALTPNPGSIVSPRVVIESVDVSTQGIDATVEVRLTADNQPAVGVASGPNFDGYMLKLAALAAASAVDQLLIDADASVRARCYIEHAAVVSLGGCEVAVVVLLLMYDGFVEQLTGSAVVSGDGDSRQAVVRATMAAVNRRLEALLP